ASTLQAAIRREPSLDTSSTGGPTTYVSIRSRIRARVRQLTHADSVAYREWDASSTNNQVDLHCVSVTNYYDVPATSTSRIRVNDLSNGVWQDYGELNGSKTWDPPSLAAGASTSTTVTVTGAAGGDFVVTSFSVALAIDMTMTARVPAANTVTVKLQNDTAAPVDVVSGTLRVRVLKRQGSTPRH